MSAMNDLIAELVGAANQLGKLDHTEKRHLLERAITAICDMREHVGIPSSATDADGLADIQATANGVAESSDEAIQAALLSAAGMIRDLHIIVDTETVIEARKPDAGDPGNY